MKGDGLGLLAVGLVALAGCGEQNGTGEVHTPAQPAVRLPAICIGPEVPADAWGADPSGQDLPPDQGDAGVVEPELGEPAPVWALEDFQPQSCGYEAVYGLGPFLGQVAVVAVWSGS